MMVYPKKIYHWLKNKDFSVSGSDYFKKINPADGEILAEAEKGGEEALNKAIDFGLRGFEVWSAIAVEERAEILKRAANLIQERKGEISEIVALESGKPEKYAIGEAEAAVKCGLYFCSNLGAFQPEKFQSANSNREISLVRQSIGVGALITPFNNPLAGIAIKSFPALLCGNSVVVKSHELTPYIAVWFAKILKEAGLPEGVFNVVQGLGSEVGAPLAADPRIKFVSFTGSLVTGQKIIKTAADRLAKVLIEAGGKNPLVVCDDADLDKAANAAVAGAFVDAGQRCAATSRIIVFAPVYDEFKKIFLDKVQKLKVGISDSDDYGAIISEKRMNEILAAVSDAAGRGAKLLTGGQRIGNQGYFVAPTVLENVPLDDELSCKEIFGPVAALYKVKNLGEAIKLANKSEFRLSSAIHTKDTAKANEFIVKHLTGVVRVNGPTHGSEPRVPFGGVGLSGNGWREPGIKALDFYSDWKQVSFDK